MPFDFICAFMQVSSGSTNLLLNTTLQNIVSPISIFGLFRLVAPANVSKKGGGEKKEEREEKEKDEEATEVKKP